MGFNIPFQITDKKSINPFLKIFLKRSSKTGFSEADGKCPDARLPKPGTRP
jgi:hypothetical protein